jgi:anthranilate 1,2-dioxygenase large subunit
MNAPEHRIPDISWPRNDYSRVPFRVHHDEEIYQLEMERIFRGPTWSYLCLEAEIPNPGDYRTTWIGDTPVIVTRDKQGGLNAFVNRCSHKGAMILRQVRGNADRLVCLYHRWTYSHKGELTGLPFRQGLKGEGGMPADFDMKSVSPRKLKAQSFHGMIFGTFQPEKAEPLEQYLGEFGTGIIKRFFEGKPIKILGYSRQKIAGNWKLYAENLRDTYHASLLHEFFVTYGLDRATQKGGVKMDARHRHNMNHAYAGSDSDEDAKAAYAGTAARLDRLKLRDTKVLQYRHEFADGMNLAAPTFFPNALLIQINNSLGTRQIRPKGVDAHEVFQTLFCYESDDEEMVRHRLLSANLVGPAGLVSMEDGEAIEVVQKATRSAQGSHAVIEMGGRGEVKDLAHRVTETPIRGFWSYWAELMGIEAQNGIR